MRSGAGANYDELRVVPGQAARLAERDPRFCSGFADKSEARDKLSHDIEHLVKLQAVFAAAATHALLIVLQGMDTAGKDGAIRHVMSGVNPQGVDVASFKTPTPEEERHDFLWRTQLRLPERGRIGIFNRSYYEEVIVVRVHREMLALEATPVRAGTWTERFEDINAFERHLTRSGTVVLKFFLHLSREEQRRRLLARLRDSEKNWKFSLDDVRERAHWERYQTAYEEMLTATSTPEAPWHVIPADRKWFMRTAIGDIIVAKLDALGLRYPPRAPDVAPLLDQLRIELEREKPPPGRRGRS
jgi:PPK2 family polyphosphate:nucleotide phosphotransferase